MRCSGFTPRWDRRRGPRRRTSRPRTSNELNAFLTLTFLLVKFATTTLWNTLRSNRRHRATLLQLKLQIDEIDDVDDATVAFERLSHGSTWREAGVREVERCTTTRPFAVPGRVRLGSLFSELDADDDGVLTREEV